LSARIGTWNVERFAKSYRLVQEKITLHKIAYSDRDGNLAGLIYIPKTEFNGTLYPVDLTMALADAAQEALQTPDGLAGSPEEGLTICLATLIREASYDVSSIHTAYASSQVRQFIDRNYVRKTA
jgi:hypothetical protein